MLDPLLYYVSTAPHVCYVAQALGLLHVLCSLSFSLDDQMKSSLFSI